MRIQGRPTLNRRSVDHMIQIIQYLDVSHNSQLRLSAVLLFRPRLDPSIYIVALGRSMGANLGGSGTSNLCCSIATEMCVQLRVHCGMPISGVVKGGISISPRTRTHPIPLITQAWPPEQT